MHTSIVSRFDTDFKRQVALFFYEEKIP